MQRAKHKADYCYATQLSVWNVKRSRHVLTFRQVLREARLALAFRRQFNYSRVRRFRIAKIKRVIKNITDFDCVIIY